MPPPLLEVRNLCVEFRSLADTVHANRGVSYTVDRGETLAVLGESGSGKSVSASAVMGILDCPPDEIRAGMPVEATFVPVTDDVTLVKFRRCS